MEQALSRSRDWKLTFFPIWIGQAFSVAGSSVAGFALVWWLTRTTGSATVLATASLVATLPGILLGPFAGALVDRWDRQRVMIVADGFVAAVSAWLACLFWVGAMQPWHVYVIMLARSLGGCFHWPAMEASTSLMVPKGHLSRVAGMNQTLRGVTNMLAPPVGALLITIMPLYGVMAIDVATAVLAISPLFFVRIPQPERRAAAGPISPATVWQDVAAGLRYVWGWPGMRLLVLMAVVLNLVGAPAFTLVPILVTKHFRGGAMELGWMDSAWGVGLVLGGLLLSAWGGFRRRILTTLLGLVGAGVAGVLVGLAPPGGLWLAVGALFVGGLMNVLINGPIFAIMQSTVEPQVQGRVFTMIGSLCSAATPLGLAVGGPVADLLGVSAWWLLNGATCLLMGLAGYFMPAVVHLEDNHRRMAAPEAA